MSEVMTDDQITALAREYAEGIYRNAHKEMEVLPDCLSNELINMFAEDMESKLKWLLRRYCLVEKEKLKAIRFRKVYSAEDMRSKFTEECLIDALFPEIGKEVES